MTYFLPIRSKNICLIGFKKKLKSMSHFRGIDLKYQLFPNDNVLKKNYRFCY